MAFLHFSGSVQEIFAMQVPPVRFPELLDDPHDLIDGSFYLPPDLPAASAR